MTLDSLKELEPQIVAQAGQVAVEFLRSEPNNTAEQTIADYNRIFKKVYEATTKTITDKA